MAKVDVVVPCYNYGRFLEACVYSVLNQSVKDVRVLIIDDASSDGSAAVARKLAEADFRVTVIAHPKNRGHIDTYNEGIDWAASDYFLLLSADDMLVAGALQRAVEIMDANPDVALTYGMSVDWFDDLPMPKMEAKASYSWTHIDLLEEMCSTATNLVPTPTAIARTSVQKAIGGYRKSLPHSGDLEMWLRFGANGSVARINEVQAIYRKHATAMSNAYFAAMMSDYQQCQLAFDSFFDEYDDRLGSTRSLRDVVHRALAGRVFHRGITLLRRRRFKEGIQFIREAMDMDRRLRYFPPIWQLLKVPGPAARERLKSAVGEAASRLVKYRDHVH
jgi:glycosyltransferase involved in cell wall biosynthesis